MAEALPNQNHLAESPTSQLSASQTAFFSNPDLHRYCDEVSALVKGLKEAAAKMPSYETLEESEIVYPVQKGKKRVQKNALEAEQPKGLEEIQHGATPLINQVLSDLDAEKEVSKKIYIPSSTITNHPFLLHSKRLLSCMIIVPENLGCTTDCGAPEPNLKVLSKFILEKQKLFDPVFSLRKDVIDLSFFVHKDYPME